MKCLARWSTAGIKIAGRNINNLRYADDTTLMAESEELKSLLVRVKEESEKVGLKLNIQKTKIMVSGPITSWQIDGETMETVTDFVFLGSKITADGDCSHKIKRRLLLGRTAIINLDNILKSRDITLRTKIQLRPDWVTELNWTEHLEVLPFHGIMLGKTTRMNAHICVSIPSSGCMSSLTLESVWGIEKITDLEAKWTSTWIKRDNTNLHHFLQLNMPHLDDKHHIILNNLYNISHKFIDLNHILNKRQSCLTKLIQLKIQLNFFNIFREVPLLQENCIVIDKKERKMEDIYNSKNCWKYQEKVISHSLKRMKGKSTHVKLSFNSDSIPGSITLRIFLN